MFVFLSSALILHFCKAVTSLIRSYAFIIHWKKMWWNLFLITWYHLQPLFSAQCPRVLLSWSLFQPSSGRRQGYTLERFPVHHIAACMFLETRNQGYLERKSQNQESQAREHHLTLTYTFSISTHLPPPYCGVSGIVWSHKT